MSCEVSNSSQNIACLTLKFGHRDWSCRSAFLGKLKPSWCSHAELDLAPASVTRTTMSLCWRGVCTVCWFLRLERHMSAQQHTSYRDGTSAPCHRTRTTSQDRHFVTWEPPCRRTVSIEPHSHRYKFFQGSDHPQDNHPTKQPLKTFWGWSSVIPNCSQQHAAQHNRIIKNSAPISKQGWLLASW